MKLPIRKYGDPILRAKGRAIARVDAKVRELAANMLETMEEANGVGLAAQQVGEALQLTVIDVSKVEDRPSTLRVEGKEVDPVSAMPLVLINPTIELEVETVSGTEGCLSFPEVTAEVNRADMVKVAAETLDGEILRLEATGLLARALQHEIDHLNGILFIDRMDSATKATLESRLKRMRKEWVAG